MATIDYKRAFSKLSHIKALSHDQKFDEIVQNLIIFALAQALPVNPKNENEVALRIFEIYGIEIRSGVLLSNLDKLRSVGKIERDRSSKEYFVNSSVLEILKKRIQEGTDLESNVRQAWFDDLKKHINGINSENLEKLWICLQTYLCNVFEQHGIQTLKFLNPNTKIADDDQKSFLAIIDALIKSMPGSNFSRELLTAAINNFISEASTQRASYISQLADSTFTSFALTSDAETLNFLNQRYNNLQLFLDTNFIFGILDLHKNSEDASSREILEEVKRNKLPFKLAYHPETLMEFRRAFDARAMHVRATKWTRESSRVALTVGGLSPLEKLFHKDNIEEEIDPHVFLDKYDHVDLILKDLGLIEANTSKVTNMDQMADLESDIESYKDFYEGSPSRKFKSYLGFKHDIVVLREVRSRNPKKTKFLESNAFFVSSDFVLAKFENRHYKKSWEINYVVSPSVFLQLIRPFIENDYSANKRFIDTFLIPDLRSFDIDYSSTRTKALQILNDNYHNVSFETKVKMLRDQVLMEKLTKATEDVDNQVKLIESQIAIENQILLTQKSDVLAKLDETIREKNEAEELRFSLESDLIARDNAIDALKSEHGFEKLKQELALKEKIQLLLSKTIMEAEKQREPLLKIIANDCRMHKFYLISFPVCYTALIIFLIFKFGWNLIEPFAYILSIASLVMGYIYLAVRGESFNPNKYFRRHREDITLKVFKKFNFDNAEIEKNKSSKVVVDEEILEIRGKI